MASGLPYGYLNTACVLDADTADIDAARAWYSRRRLAWGVVVPASSLWPHGRKLLSQRLMAAEPARFSPAPQPAGLVVRRARAEDIDIVTMVDNGAFGSDATSSRAWLGALCRSAEVEVAIAELAGAPVAAGYGTRCSGEAGPSLYVGGIGVLPAARRRGVGAYLSGWLAGRGFEQGAALGPPADRIGWRGSRLLEARLRGVQRHRHLHRTVSTGLRGTALACDGDERPARRGVLE